MRNFFKDAIFTNFIYSCEFETPSVEVLDACVFLPSCYESVALSNRSGWQSPIFTKDFLHAAFSSLKSEVLNFAAEVSRMEQLDVNFNVSEFWVNLNSSSAYNVPHPHPGSDLVVVYYADVPKDSGDLVLVRNDSGLNSRLFINKPREFHFSLKPQTGRAYAFPAWLLHYVEAGQSVDVRVSVSFNLHI